MIKIIDKIKLVVFESFNFSNSTLVYDFMNSNKKFNTIACDYRPSLIHQDLGESTN